MPPGTCYLGHRQLLFWGGWQELLFPKGGGWRRTAGALHCGVLFTLGAHDPTEAKVEGGAEGVGECRCREVAAGQHWGLSLCFLREKSAAALPWVLESLVLLPTPRTQKTARAGRWEGRARRGSSTWAAIGAPGGCAALGPPPPRAALGLRVAAPAALPGLRWALGLSTRAPSSRVRGSISGLTRAEGVVSSTRKTSKTLLPRRRAGISGATREAQNLKIVLPVPGQGALGRKDEQRSPVCPHDSHGFCLGCKRRL